MKDQARKGDPAGRPYAAGPRISDLTSQIRNILSVVGSQSALPVNHWEKHFQGHSPHGVLDKFMKYASGFERIGKLRSSRFLVGVEKFVSRNSRLGANYS